MIKKVLMLNVGDIFTIPDDADVYMLIPNTYIITHKHHKINTISNKNYQKCEN